MSTRSDDVWTLGETWSEQITCTNSNGSAISSITDADWALKIPSGEVVLQKVTPNPNITVTGNVVTVTVSSTDQDLLVSRTYQRRLKITDGDGAKSRQIHGYITVLPDD